MIPHERSLVEKYKGRPFVIVGVESEPDIEFARRKSKEAGIAWRNFWNGPIPQFPRVSLGPISGAWGISSWPTVFLLDANGRVRYRNPRGEALDRAIESLLDELVAAESRPDSRR
jgi:hypothetical protein